MSQKIIPIIFVAVIFFIGLKASLAQAAPPADAQFFEAETMTNDGVSWVPRYIPGSGDWHSYPSGLSLLYGASKQAGTASKTINVPSAGRYRVWARYIDHRTYRGPFKMTINQGGQTKGEKMFDEISLPNRDDYGLDYTVFVWDYLDIDLDSGSVDFSLYKETSSIWVTRRIDCFVITKDMTYLPRVHDFLDKPLFVKVKMTESHPDPSVVHIFGKTPDEEENSTYIHANFTKNGIFSGARIGINTENFMAAGEESPWWDVSQLMGFSDISRFRFYATKNYYDTLPSADFKVYFSRTPSDSGIFKEFSKSGKGGAIYVTANLFFEEKNKSDAEYVTEVQNEVNKIELSGKRAEKFPIITGMSTDLANSSSFVEESEMSALGKLGFNGFSKNCTKKTMENGFIFPACYSHIFHCDLNGHLVDPDVSCMESGINPVTENLVAIGAEEKNPYFSLMDEPESDTFDEIINGGSLYQSKFEQYLKEKNLTPSYFGKSSWSEVKPTKDKAGEPRTYFETAKFRNKIMTDYFRISSQIVKNKMPNAKTTTNHGESLTFNGNLLRHGDDWFLTHRSDALTYGFTEDWLLYSATYQLLGYRADFLRSATQGRFGMYDIVSSRLPVDISAKAAAEIGHGAEAINFYSYGPYYQEGDQWSTRYGSFSGIAKTTRSIGEIEEYLIDTNVPKSKIALLYSHTTDIWRMDTNNAGGIMEEAYSVFGKERMYIYLLLRHLGYPVEIITEDDILAGKLSEYEMVFLDGSHLQRGVSDNIKTWVESGGKFYLGAGSAMFDEENKNNDLGEKLGIKRKSFEYDYAKNNPGNDLLVLDNRTKLDSVDYAGQSIEAIVARQKFESVPAEAVVLAKFQDGTPAMASWNLGGGKVFSSGFFPGLAYAKAGILAKEDADKAGERSTYNPPSFPSAPRNLFGAIMNPTNYAPPVKTSDYLVEANVIEGEKGLVVTLSNWSGEEKKNLIIDVNLSRPVKSPIASAAKINSAQNNGSSLKLDVDLSAFGFIVLPYDGLANRSDLNLDSFTNVTDLDILKTDFLKLTANLTNPRSDINLDGQCTVRDLGILMSGWGK